MKNIDFTTLRLIVLVDEVGSLSAAARQYSLTLAAISKRLLEAEALLDVRLFDRSAKGMVATLGGRAVVAHARQLLYEMDRMQADISEYRTGEAGYVRVGGNTSAMTQFLPERLSSFSRRHPAIRLDLAEQPSDEIVARLANGRLDVGLFSANAGHSGLHVRQYSFNHLCVVVPKNSRLARRKSVNFSALLDQPFVGLESDSALMHLLQNKAFDRHLRVPVQVRSFDVACRFVQAGIGIGILPIGSATLYAKAMDLAVVKLSDAWAEYPLLIGTRSLDTLSASSRLLLDDLVQGAKQP